jgi:hypothetical protein
MLDVSTIASQQLCSQQLLHRMLLHAPAPAGRDSPKVLSVVVMDQTVIEIKVDKARLDDHCRNCRPWNQSCLYSKPGTTGANADSSATVLL